MESLGAIAVFNALNGTSHPLTHGLLSYTQTGLVSVVKACNVIHSKEVPPDAARAQNIGKTAHQLFKKYNFSGTISGLEFC